MTVGAFCGIYRGDHPLAKWIFMSASYNKAVSSAIQGGNGAIANLHGEDILGMSFKIPTNASIVSHLQKILSRLDNKIEDSERMESLFLQQKYFLLNQMFI